MRVAEHRNKLQAERAAPGVTTTVLRFVSFIPLLFGPPGAYFGQVRRCRR